jgi:hypothetical protein
LAVGTDLETEVWLAQGVADLRPAVLRLADGRLRLVLEDGSCAFDALARDVRHHSRWYWFGSVFDLVVGGVRYRIALSRGPDGDGAGLGSARTVGARWKQALESFL